MQKTLSVIFLVFFLFTNCLHAQDVPVKGLNQISEPMVKELIDYLAADDMRGRSTPSIELDKAADYIASKLKEYGVKPVNKSYFQSLPFVSKDLDVDQCSFLLTKDGVNHAFTLKSHFTPLFNTVSGKVKGEIVFAGYGITAPEYNYDDYKDIDVKGKIVLVMKQAPRKKDAGSDFATKEAAKYADIDYKVKNATEHGAIGFLLVTDPIDNIAITAQGYLWRSLYMKHNSSPIYELTESSENTLPAVQVGWKIIDEIVGGVDSLRTLQENIDANLKPISFPIENQSLELAVSLDEKSFPSKNVVGWIEGSDAKLKKEFVVVGGHYDHIGVSDLANHLNDSIMNGADDNASGTAAVMAIAKAFSKSGKKPARSLVFILFTAEERGLLGSTYYTNNPLFPLEKTVGMINMDMVGRNGTDTLYVVGEKYNPELTKLVNAEIPEAGLKKEEMSFDLYQSSDYYPFYKKGISAIGFTSGLHNDYHRVGDNPDKINHTKVRKIAQLGYRVAWKMANSNNYFSIIEPGKNKK